MAATEHIRLIPAAQIDRQLWDACVTSDTRATIYSLSWVLDALSDDWEGLVGGDYQTVLALPVKRRAGLKMVYVPPFIQRLGFAGSQDSNTLNAFIKIIEGRYRLMEYAASRQLSLRNTACHTRTNYILNLNRYEDVRKNYSEACIKNLRKSEKRGAQFAEDLQIDEVIQLFRQAYGNKAAYTADHYLAVHRLYKEALKHGSAILAGVRNETGELVYGAFLLKDTKRIYYLIGAPTDTGRTMRATYFFIDQIFQRWSASGLTFDFEGSDIPSVADFYRSFGPEKETYYRFFRNAYPFPLKQILDRKLGWKQS